MIKGILTIRAYITIKHQLEIIYGERSVKLLLIPFSSFPFPNPIYFFQSILLFSNLLVKYNIFRQFGHTYGWRPTKETFLTHDLDHDPSRSRGKRRSKTRSWSQRTRKAMLSSPEYVAGWRLTKETFLTHDLDHDQVMVKNEVKSTKFVPEDKEGNVELSVATQIHTRVNSTLPSLSSGTFRVFDLIFPVTLTAHGQGHGSKKFLSFFCRAPPRYMLM